MAWNRTDYTGRTIGRFIVISRRGISSWNCRCSCGSLFVLAANDFHKRKSCGCRSGITWSEQHHKLLKEKALLRFWSRVTKTASCWLWFGEINSRGYGVFKGAGFPKKASHRFAYELLVGPIQPGLVLDHLCRNKLCCNPKHLEPVSNGENVLRGVGVSARNAAATHCKRGHPFDGDNTYLYRGHRTCRACYRLYRKQSNHGTN